MKKNVQNIALILLVFITYPFVFQALHILYHDHGHSPDINGLTHSCIASGASCNSNNDDRHHSSVPALLFHILSAVPVTESGGNHCPLCEHDFAKFRVGSIFQIAFSNETFSLVYSDLYQVPGILFSGNHISLRAPPHLS
jgi:hypothetical protein